MLDPLLSLAFTVHAGPGVYALLLGSGVSRSAGIPTGYDITLDLIRKVARLRGDDCGDNPSAWYQATYVKDPSYSDLLKDLGPSREDRQAILRTYFEPNEDERQQGLKLPTRAHHAIARLVAGGHVRVIVTTNFDRLLEQSLAEAGVVPAVLSTTDAIRGAPPIERNHCTIIKANGDYLDPRIRNTPEELAKYDAPLRKLLDRVFDEFGLIVCGWSADWDVALGQLIERAPNRRYATYWTTRGRQSDTTQRLATARAATLITITDADHFFTDVSEKVQSLADISQPHPLEPKIAVATLKRYLPEPAGCIRVHDLVHEETTRMVAEIGEIAFPVHQAEFSIPNFQVRLARYESVTATLRALFATGCHWSRPDHLDVWRKSLETVANRCYRGGASAIWLNLTRYPALLLLYAGGLAAVAAQNYNVLTTLLINSQIEDVDTKQREPAALKLYPDRVLNRSIVAKLPGRQHQRIPDSEYIHDVVREDLRPLLPGDSAYDDAFDRFECFIALLHIDLRLQTGNRAWAPLGRFSWRRREDKNHVARLIQQEIERDQARWPPLAAGLFRGRLTDAQSAMQGLNQVLQNTPCF